MKKYSILTALPSLFDTHFKHLPFSRALEKGSIDIDVTNLRDFALDKYGTIDGKPYGGGVGMLLRIEPIVNALEDIKEKNGEGKIILLSPKGEKLTQKKVVDLAKEEHLIFVCGRYEGFDARVKEYADEIISVGDYVLSGGELPALIIMESITRILPGVLEKEEATQIESFSDGGNLEFPQYTRPEEYEGKKVPEILLSGNHAEIEKWRKKNSLTKD